MSPGGSGSNRVVLGEVLEEGQVRGLIGPGHLSEHLRHAMGFVGVLRGRGWDMASAPGTSRHFKERGTSGPRLLDLGSGGGLPGLVIACAWSLAQVVLLDSQRRRADFLEAAVAKLGLEGRVLVRCERAETAGRDPLLRGQLDGVVSRAFGPPPVTAECGAPFLRTGGWLVVSEPPGAEAQRWPAAGLVQLGLVADEAVRLDGFGYRCLRQVRDCPSRFPRRPGVPSKRPLFHVKPKSTLDTSGR